ncbi:hypothetical protein Q1695_013947 [Nippostrongylus brasiliensis]|nr:hypothetical protein Q1695_013947 [Nippostrongylus brasiliensis]
MKKGRRKSKPKKKKPTDSSTESIEGSIASSELESDESLVPPTPAPVGVVGTVRNCYKCDFYPKVLTLHFLTSSPFPYRDTDEGEKLKTFSDVEWEQGEEALPANLIKTQISDKKISVFAPRVGAASAKKSKKRTQSAEKLKQQKELDSKIDLIGQFVAAAVKVMSNSATGVDDVEVTVSVRFTGERAISI